MNWFRWVIVAYIVAEFLFTPSIGLVQSHSSGAQTMPGPAGYPTAAPVVCGSAVSSCILKAAPGQLWRINVQCSGACWLMLFNATSPPADGSTTAGTASGNLQDCFQLQTGATAAFADELMPAQLVIPEIFTTGITAVLSSTACATKTAAAVGFVNAIVQ